MEALEEQAHQRARRLTGGQRRGLAVEDGGQGAGRGILLERGPARHHLVEHTAEAEHVRARIDGLALGLLRRHVLRRAHDSFLGNGGFAGGREGLQGQSKVDHLHQPPVRHHDVGGLEVAVDDAGVVSRGERARDLGGAVEERARRQATRADCVAQGLARDPLHDDEVDVPGPTGFVHGHDVGMIERGGGLGFAGEALPAFVVRLAGENHLEGDGATEQIVGGLVHGPHAASAQASSDRVVPELATRRVGFVSGRGRSRENPDSGWVFLQRQLRPG